MLISGCSKDAIKEHSIYNAELSKSFENKAYRIYTVRSDSGKIEIKFKNKATGEVQSLVRDPLQSLSEFAESIYGDGDYVYYVKFDVDKSRFFDTYSSISIIRVSTKNFSERNYI